MLITVSVGTGGDKLISLEVDPSTTIDVLKSMLAIESGIAVEQQSISFNGKPIAGNGTLEASGVAANDMLLLLGAPTPSANVDRLSQLPTNLSPQDFHRAVHTNPSLQAEMARSNPQLAAAALSPDPTQFVQMIQGLERQALQRRMQQQQQIAALNNNWWDPDAQAKIEEAIRQENVMSNFEQAMEYTPEAFGRVVMLYVDTEVNGHPVKAFVDSGAQSTIMSTRCAERCGLMRLIDTRFAGVAKGVGTAKIVGRVHMAQIKIGETHVASSFTILDQNDMEFLIGLDWLKHHQCQIDLRDNVLRIGDKGSVPFLAEKDIPLHLREESGETGAVPPSPKRQAIESTGAPTAVPAPASTTTTSVPQPAATPTTSSTPTSTTTTATSGATGSLLPANLLPPSLLPPSMTASSPTTAPPAAQANPAGNPSSTGDPSGPVQQLVAMGFTAQQAQMALQQTGGNLELAAALLFEQGFYG